MNIQKIVAQFNISLDQAAEVAVFAHTNVVNEELFEILNDYYIDNNEMPYEVAAHGDPYEWIKAELVRTM